MANPPSDQGIPLLTEVIGPQPEAGSAASGAAPTSVPPAAAAMEPSSAPAQPVPPPSPVQKATPPSPAATAAAGVTDQPKPPAAAAPIAPTPASLTRPPSGASALRPAIAPGTAGQAPSAQAATGQGFPAQAAGSTIPVKPTVPPPPAPIDSNRPDAEPSAPMPELSSSSSPNIWSESELRDLENELRLRITRQVLGRIDFVLDHRVRNTVTEVVDAAIDALAVEIKRGLHETITDIVARAVAQEISRLQTGKK